MRQGRITIMIKIVSTMDLPEGQPDRRGSHLRGEIGQRRFAVKFAGAPGRLQTKPTHHLEGSLAQSRAIRGKQNPRVALRHFQGGEQKRLEIVLDLEGFAAMRAREGRRIENDYVEFFTFPRKP